MNNAYTDGPNYAVRCYRLRLAGCAIWQEHFTRPLSHWGKGRGPSQADSSKKWQSVKRSPLPACDLRNPRFAQDAAATVRPIPSSFLEPRTSETGIHTFSFSFPFGPPLSPLLDLGNAPEASPCLPDQADHFRRYSRVSATAVLSPVELLVQQVLEGSEPVRSATRNRSMDMLPPASSWGLSGLISSLCDSSSS